MEKKTQLQRFYGIAAWRIYIVSEQVSGTRKKKTIWCSLLASVADDLEII